MRHEDGRAVTEAWHCQLGSIKSPRADDCAQQRNNQTQDVCDLAGAEGLEPTTLGFGDRCSTN